MTKCIVPAKTQKIAVSRRTAAPPIRLQAFSARARAPMLPSVVAMAELAGNPLTVTRVRAVLSFLTHNGTRPAGSRHASLMRDYLRMMEIHGSAVSLREAIGAAPDARAAIDIARIAALRAQLSWGAHDQRPEFAPEEEAAVRACSAEIDAALRRLQA